MDDGMSRNDMGWQFDELCQQFFSVSANIKYGSVSVTDTCAQ